MQIIRIIGEPNWPQDVNIVPTGAAMPPINKDNAEIVEREAFTLSTTINIPANTAKGKQFSVTIPTDQDGDLWVENIFAVGWNFNAGGPLIPQLVPGFISISDVRTGRFLTYTGTPASVLHPNCVPIQIFDNTVRFQEAGTNFDDAPPPKGFRSTATLIKPFCFTRQGGVALNFITNYDPDIQPTLAYSIDLAFAGWKEYAYAS